MERLAWGVAATGQFASAVRLCGTAHAQRRMLGITLRHELSVDHDELEAEARQQLGAAYDADWLAGEESSVDDAVALALDLTRSSRMTYAPRLQASSL
jgi:hypothetical protein